jgi:uncharacterized membrane protein YeaQ/YmgE (transglycosylase-associated protein family)
MARIELRAHAPDQQVSPLLRVLLEERAMTLLELIVYFVIAGVCGAIARAIAGGTGRGFFFSVLLGFAGAIVSTWFAREFHLPPLIVVTIDAHPFPIVWSIVGGLVLVAIAHALRAGPRGYVNRYVR